MTLQADGRLLYVYMKQGPPIGRIQPPRAPPTGPRSQVELLPKSQREDSGRERGSADVEMQDGRYGFGEKTGGQARDDHGLYSDSMVSRGKGRR